MASFNFAKHHIFTSTINPLKSIGPLQSDIATLKGGCVSCLLIIKSGFLFVGHPNLSAHSVVLLVAQVP